jgi:glucose-6-phosphate 1-epimerase
MGAALDDIQILQGRFGISGAVRFTAGENGMARVLVTTPQAEAELYLHGAHLTRYQPRGERPLLFLSAQSRFAPDAPIRGGVPIVFPWFGPKAGDPTAPMHGFVRTQAWRVESVAQDPDGQIAVTLGLDCTGSAPGGWSAAFALRFHVRVGSRLEISLEARNPSAAPLTIEEALHTYLAVGDVRQISIAGLAGSVYIDKTDAARRKAQGPEPIRITQETDRVYLGTRSTCAVDDPAWGRRLVLEKSGSDATVLWNPWIAKAAAMPDFGDAEWPGMLCIETANVAEHAVTLQPGQHHELRVVLHSQPA